MTPKDARSSHQPLSDIDIHLFNEGTHRRLYERLGAHPDSDGADAGVSFAVWAPAAARVDVIGDFNDWQPGTTLAPRDTSGLWEGFVPGAEVGQAYKYLVETSAGERLEKADPFAFATEVPPKTASVVWDLSFEWGDEAWMSERRAHQALDAPISVYEVHLGSWRRSDQSFIGYREAAPLLIDHLRRTGFTHVQFLPLMEHPFYGSWGYQTTGYFAPTARYGTPQDLMFLIDELHRSGYGVILDWVPSHFPDDPHGLARFDGTHLYEHADPRQGVHPDWGSLVFNYGRNEVRSFLSSSAAFWLDRFHADGLRVDAVASMLYLDYSRSPGEWIPNRYGGRENLEAIGFLRDLNEAVYEDFPDVQTVAEESTAWPMVSRPTYLGGLGFGLKWDMGWMHDTLSFMSHEPVHRSWHHHEMTFRAIYQFNENFMLPLSHDEVVHGKGSLLAKMPGDEWQKRANLRALYGAMYAQPGKKLLFMGAELGQGEEWSHEGEIDWSRLDDPDFEGLTRWIADLNRAYRAVGALHELDCDAAGFQWVEADDSANSVFAWLRRDREGRALLAVVNATPVVRHNYRLGVPETGVWNELLNSDAEVYGGSGVGNLGSVEAAPIPHHGQQFSVVVTLPPLAAVYLELGR